ncbi:MAG: hypothetical protein JSR17_04440 [Proteobacteria bacterium]|nr:hypothetical protein [Pseudomonadota bacterium]
MSNVGPSANQRTKVDTLKALFPEYASLAIVRTPMSLNQFEQIVDSIKKELNPSPLLNQAKSLITKPLGKAANSLKERFEEATHLGETLQGALKPFQNSQIGEIEMEFSKDQYQCNHQMEKLYGSDLASLIHGFYIKQLKALKLYLRYHTNDLHSEVDEFAKQMYERLHNNYKKLSKPEADNLEALLSIYKQDLALVKNYLITKQVNLLNAASELLGEIYAMRGDLPPNLSEHPVYKEYNQQLSSCCPAHVLTEQEYNKLDESKKNECNERRNILLKNLRFILSASKQIKRYESYVEDIDGYIGLSSIDAVKSKPFSPVLAKLKNTRNNDEELNLDKVIMGLDLREPSAFYAYFNEVVAKKYFNEGLYERRERFNRGAKAYNRGSKEVDGQCFWYMLADLPGEEGYFLFRKLMEDLDRKSIPQKKLWEFGDMFDPRVAFKKYMLLDYAWMTYRRSLLKEVAKQVAASKQTYDNNELWHSDIDAFYKLVLNNRLGKVLFEKTFEYIKRVRRKPNGSWGQQIDNISATSMKENMCKIQYNQKDHVIKMELLSALICWYADNNNFPAKSDEIDRFFDQLHSKSSDIHIGALTDAFPTLESAKQQEEMQRCKETLLKETSALDPRLSVNDFCLVQPGESQPQQNLAEVAPTVADDEQIAKESAQAEHDNLTTQEYGDDASLLCKPQSGAGLCAWNLLRAFASGATLSCRAFEEPDYEETNLRLKPH